MVSHQLDLAHIPGSQRKKVTEAHTSAYIHPGVYPVSFPERSVRKGQVIALPISMKALSQEGMFADLDLVALVTT